MRSTVLRSFCLSGHLDQLFSLNAISDQVVGKKVDESRKSASTLVRVIGSIVERTFMHGIVTNCSAGFSERSRTWGKVDFFELFRKCSFFRCAQMDSQLFKTQAKHCAGTSGRSADYALSFQERVFCFIRQMLGRWDGGAIRPDYFFVQSKGKVLANLASNKKNLRWIVELCEIFKTNRFITENGIELIVPKWPSWARVFQDKERGNQMRTAVRTYQ